MAGRIAGVTALTTRPKGMARDIKAISLAVVNTYQLKVSAARIDRCDAGSSAVERCFVGGLVSNARPPVDDERDMTELQKT
jgi:hypothetical protein